MAREQRTDVDYFPHDCTHGRKMHIIESKYKNDGYATWFKILERLGKANNHYIDISDESDLMFLVSVCNVDEEKLVSILNDLAKLGAIDKFLYENHKVIYSQKFTNSIEDAYRKRKNGIIQYSALLEIIASKNGQSGGSLTVAQGNPAEVILKEKDSKEEKRREEKSKVESKSHSAEKSAASSEGTNPPKRQKKVTEVKFWQTLVDQWFEFYKSKFIISPTFNPTEGKHFKSILLRFEKMAKEKDEKENITFDWTEDRAKRTMTRFLDNAWADKWLKDHFLLKNLVSNFDAIINKTAANEKKSSVTTNR